MSEKITVQVHKDGSMTLDVNTGNGQCSEKAKQFIKKMEEFGVAPTITNQQTGISDDDGQKITQHC